MRNQFYGDRKDVLKWTFALRAAGTSKAVLYVAMLRPNKGQHGLDFTEVDGADPLVVEFFKRERTNFGSSSYRAVARISALSPCIELVHDLYIHGDRHTYFHTVSSRLKKRPARQLYVVLLDPDNGVGGKCPKSEHVCDKDISTVWSAMIPGDVLIVYQHQFRDKEWLSKRQSQVAAATGVPNVTCRRDNDVQSVCFFEVVKPGFALTSDASH